MACVQPLGFIVNNRSLNDADTQVRMDLQVGHNLSWVNISLSEELLQRIKVKCTLFFYSWSLNNDNYGPTYIIS